MGYKANGVDTGGLPMHLVTPIIEKYHVPYFIETGTAGGESARLGATMFYKVWTVELIEDRQEISEEDNITWIVGDSVTNLPLIIEQIKLPAGSKERQFALFYLDAHYSDIVPNESDYPECPVLKEIECVAQYGEDAIIIIDDARLFFGNPPYPHDPREWPSLMEIFMLLNEKFPFHHTTITDDYIISVPLHVRDVIDKEWRDRFDERYPNDEERLRIEMRNVHNHLKAKYAEFLKYIE